MSTSSAIPEEPAATSGAPASPELGQDESDQDAPRAGRKQRWWKAPFRWIRKAASRIRKAASKLLRPVVALTRPLRALVKSPFRLAKAVFMATIGKDRGFGFWWLVATLALAVAIGLILAVVLSPVLGLLAAIIVGIWMLVKRSGSSDSDEDRDSGDVSQDPGPRPENA